MDDSVSAGREHLEAMLNDKDFQSKSPEWRRAAVVKLMGHYDPGFAASPPEKQLSSALKVVGSMGHGDLLTTASVAIPHPLTGKPITLTPLNQAFAGDTLRLQMMRSGPNPGRTVAEYIKSKGYKPLGDPSANYQGSALWQGPGGTIVNANEFMPGAAMLATGIPLALSTAAQAGTEYATGSPFLGGAAGNVTSDLYDAAMRRMLDIPREPISPTGLAESAAIGGAFGKVPDVMGGITGLRGVRKAATGAYEQAGREGEALASTQAGVGRQIQSDRDAAVRGAVGSAQEETAKARDVMQGQRDKLAAQQEAIRNDIAQRKQAAAQGATIPTSPADAARAKLRSLTTKGLEAERPEAAQAQAERLMGGMLNKSTTQAAVERAAPQGQAADALARSKSTYFEALNDIRTARQAPFEKAMEPIRDKPVEDLSNLQKTVGDIQGTPGLHIRTTELKQAFDRVRQSSSEQFQFPNKTAFMGGELGDIKDPTQRRAQEAVLLRSGMVPPKSEKPLTYGELWRLRNDAWTVIRRSNDPEERAAAHQFADEADNIFEQKAPVDQASKNQYALYKSSFTPKLTRDIAGARTPGEAGKAIFTQPEGTVLQLAQAAKTPEAKTQLQNMFGSYVRESGLSADKMLQSTNPAVLRAMYGKDAEPLLRLAGPDMQVKSASWSHIIASSPEGRKAFNQSLRTVLTDEKTQQARVALQEGLKAAQGLSKTQHEAVVKAVNSVTTPEAKLEILAKAMPGPLPDPQAAGIEAGRKAFTGFKPSERQMKVLEQEPPDPKAAARAAVEKGPEYSHWNRWAMHHTAFMLLAGGAAFEHHPVAAAGFALLGVHAGIPALLKNPGLASAYVKLLDLPPNRFTAMTAGKTIGRILASQVGAEVADSVVNAPAPEAATPEVEPPANVIGKSRR